MSEVFNTPEMTPGEFLDRFTIMIRKQKFDPENYAIRVKDYLEIMKDIKFDAQLLSMICELQMANVDIWNLEYDIRRGKEGLLGMAEVGERAIAIRDFNKRRIELVNKINEAFGITDRKETKHNHGSE